ALGFHAFTGRFTPPPPSALPAAAPRAAPAARAPAVTPDFTAYQGYLTAAPLGVGALAVAGLPAARGAGVTVMDIEGAWLWTHEDLTAPFAALGTPIADLSWRNHGTAVLGELRASDNGFGVRGIAPDCAVGAASIGDLAVSDALVRAAALLAPGDVILIELHAPGPFANGVGQYGYLPLEFWQDIFETIRLVTADGLIVCEAAGNGEQDLDDPRYAGLFDRTVRDSGAIMCGAGDGSTAWPAWFSNSGSRLDLRGWGGTVATCGYGDLQGGSLVPETAWYTNGFNGTSSASPIVAGSVAALQGMVKDAWDFPLDASLARDLLRATGTPQAGVKQVGVLPDLVAARTAALAGLGRVTGTVTDAGTGEPLAAVEVRVAETTGFDLTGPAGDYVFPLAVGSYTLRFTSFFYATTARTVTIAADAPLTADVALARLPAVTLVGRIYGASGESLGGARITPLAVPIVPATADDDGRFALPGVPVDRTYTLLIDGSPRHGAAVRALTLPADAAGTVAIYPQLPPATFTFDADDGGFVPLDSLWSWGEPARDVGPHGGFGGGRCWGVGMLADYPDQAWSTLTSPPRDVSAATALRLSLHYWSETEAGFDGVKLEATRDSVWSNVAPLNGYTDQTLGGLAYRAGWSGHSDGWRGAVFDLTAFRSPAFRFRLAFGSDAGVTGAGFWIDDVTYDLGPAAPDPNAGWPPARPGPQLRAWPSPFNPAATIAWRGAAPGPLRVTVYDLRGRAIRTLWNGPAAAAGTLGWDGTDDAARRAASGVYLVRLRDARGAGAVVRLVLAR
ncbi:MAG: carboxypeptidase regulatory-like domain-containing protein, partial [Candidatus Krumholzibacteriia bacterium]